MDVQVRKCLTPSKYPRKQQARQCPPGRAFTNSSSWSLFAEYPLHGGKVMVMVGEGGESVVRLLAPIPRLVTPRWSS